MAGADNARKRKQSTQAARAVAAARGTSNDRRNLILGIGVVVLLAIIVAVGVVYARNAQQQREAVPVTKAAAEYSAKAAPNGTVVAGQDNAKLKIDMYEDLICPACGALEARDGEKIEKAIADGKVQVTYHMLDFLDQNSNPPGYSTRAANAAVAAANFGKFADFHHSLYKQGSQPKEGTAGYDNAKLVKLGQDLGITDPGFADAVNNGKYTAPVQQDTQVALNDPNLKTDNGDGKPPAFGTPTVAQNGKKIEYSAPDWLDKLIAAANKS